MDWSAYFDFLSEDDIRVKGTRVGIEIVLDDYLNGSSPEEIAARYRLRPYASIKQIVDDLLLIWEASSPKEYLDQITYIPL